MFDFFISNANAQEAAAAAGQQGGFMSFVPFILVFFVMYFLMIRPQKKKMEAEQAMMNKLQKGDEVYTKAGVLGKIHGMTEKVITLEIAENVRIKVLRGQVGGLASTLFEAKATK
jgi:preprotein translocase subunit YajC